MISIVLALTVIPSWADSTSPTPNADKLGWHMGVQAFSFVQITFFEAVDNVNELGLKYIEAMPFGRLSPAHRNVVTDHHMPAKFRTLMKEKLRASGVNLINYGVVPLPNDEAECRKVFDFVRDMGIETIVSEPPPEAIDLIARLCDEYEINVAIHNHPIPSAYWDPQTVLNAVKGKTQRLGSCADTSHWMRSGLDVVECLKLLEGRIKSFHFGEVSGPKAAEFAERRAGLSLDDDKFPAMMAHVLGIPNVVYGTGPADMRSWLVEIQRQEIEAIFSIEGFFELPPAEVVQKMKASIEYFEGIATELSGQ
jgi:sugar phosphate isomerase/epimerase